MGGAPFNVAWHLQAFRQAPRLVSRIGNDAAGQRVLSAMQGWGMSTDCLQTDFKHPTGRVLVSLQNGEPAYDIVNDCAYDFIDAQFGEHSGGLLYHGTLALRKAVSRKAFARLRAKPFESVFMDVNLRSPWWSRNRVLHWIDAADWVKLNEAELRTLRGRSSDSLVSSAESFLHRHQLQGLVVTCGEKGAIAVVSGKSPIEVVPRHRPNTVDTVGAGDAFAAVLLLGLNLGWPIRRSLKRAQEFASALVEKRGAVVDDPGFYQTFIDAWNLR